MSDLNRRAFLAATAALGISIPMGAEAAVAERSERMSTGLRLLDFALRGGWVKGAINTVLVPLGEGRSSLVDIVAGAAHRAGHRVTLVTPFGSMQDVESAIPTSDLVVYSGVVFPWDDFDGILTAARIHRTTVVFVTQAPSAGVTSGNTNLVRMSSLVVSLPEGLKGVPRDGAVRVPAGPCEIIKSRD